MSKRVVIRPNKRAEILYRELLKRLLIKNINKLKADFVKKMKKGLTSNKIFSFYLNLFKDEGVNEIEDKLNMIFTLILTDLNNLLNLGGRTFNEVEKELLKMFVGDSLVLIESLLIDQHKQVSQILTDNLIRGATISDITHELQKVANIQKNRAEAIAITETAKANSKFAQMKLKSFGVQNVVWSSAKDKRVRKCHLARNGVKYNIEKGCYSSCDGKYLQVGYEVRCRCAMVAIL